MKLKHIPNILSVIRILLVFVMVFVLFAFDNEKRIWGLTPPIWAIIIFLTAGATDVVDGFLARKFNWITNLGKILDPFADKLMQCTILVCFCIKGYIPIWFVIPFFLKEGITLLMGLIVIKRRSVVVVSKWYGKAAVCLFYLTIVLSYWLKPWLDGNTVASVLLFSPAVIFAVAAFFAYVKHYSNLRKEEISRGKIRDVIKSSKEDENNEEANDAVAPSAEGTASEK